MSFAHIRFLRERNARLFQRRLDELQVDLRGRNKPLEFGKKLDEYLDEFERHAIVLALDHSEGDVSEAAVLLGMRAEKLREAMERHGLLISEEQES